MKLLVCSLAAVALLVGCGGGSSGPPAGAITVKLTDYKFTPDTISAPSGKVVFYLVNSGTLAHDMVIRDATKKLFGASELVAPGDSRVFTVDSIAAGSYAIFCDVTGHEALGMLGKLTIT